MHLPKDWIVFDELTVGIFALEDMLHDHSRVSFSADDQLYVNKYEDRDYLLSVDVRACPATNTDC